MSFFEYVISKHNLHGDTEKFQLPCVRYMVLSNQFDKCYKEDPNVARFILAVARIFKNYGLKEKRFDCFCLYNARSTKFPKPFNMEKLSPQTFPQQLHSVHKEYEGKDAFVPFQGTCKDFYREFDETCLGCVMCQFDTEKCNAYAKYEETLVKYLTSSPDVFAQIKAFYEEHIDELFKSKMDLHYNKESIQYKGNKPFVFAFMKSLCYVLLVYDDIRYFREDIKDSTDDYIDRYLKYMDRTYQFHMNPDVTTADRIDLENICKEFLDRFLREANTTTASEFNEAYKNITGKDIRIENYIKKKNPLVCNSVKSVLKNAEEDRVVGNNITHDIEPGDSVSDLESSEENKKNISEQDVAEKSEEDDKQDMKDTSKRETSDEKDDEDDEVSSYYDSEDADYQETGSIVNDPALDGFETAENGIDDTPVEMTEEQAKYYETAAKEHSDIDDAFDNFTLDTGVEEALQNGSMENYEDDTLSKQATHNNIEETLLPSPDTVTNVTATETTALSVTASTKLVAENTEELEYALKESEDDKWEIPVRTLGEGNYIIDNHINNLESYGIISIDNDKWYMMQFESSVLTNTFMCVEAVVDDEGKDYLVFFDRMRKTYFSARLAEKSECMEIIKPYLTRSKYIKICYQPYHLYAVGRKYGIEFKKIFSIQTCYSYLTKDWPLVGYEETINFFIDRPLSEYAPKNIPMLLVGMQMYPTICARCSKKLDDPKRLNEIDAMRYFDEALGRSYYVGDLYETTGDVPPFKLVGPNKYEFTDIERGRTLIAGEYFTCTFIPNSLQNKYQTTEDDCWELIKGAVEMLASKGRFRKLHIYITRMDKTTLKLFVPRYNISYMETSIMSVFSEVNRLKLDNKRYKMMFRQDAAEVAERITDTEKKDDKNTDENENVASSDDQT